MNYRLLPMFRRQSGDKRRHCFKTCHREQTAITATINHLWNLIIICMNYFKPRVQFLGHYAVEFYSIKLKLVKARGAVVSSYATGAP
jgi:hypothetical protein